MRTAGLTLDDVEAIDLGPPDAAPAFANGQIDAWAIWDPYYAIAAQDPNTRVLVTTEGIVEFLGLLPRQWQLRQGQPAHCRRCDRRVGQGGGPAQADLDATVKAVSAITGVPEPIQRIVLTRKNADLGQILPINDEIIAYQQSLADEFFGLKIVPRQLKITDIVWYPPAA